MSTGTTDVRWRIRLRSSPEAVFELLVTDAGRARFWARQTTSQGRAIHFEFADGTGLEARVLEYDPPRHFSLAYFEGNPVAFDLRAIAEGTELTVTEADAPPQNAPGWVSVLLALKAAADFGVDLRNGDPDAGWDQGFVDV
ncbi:MAG: hypothetical protein AAGE01_12095 [Pseudomonadota bacterium]